MCTCAQEPGKELHQQFQHVELLCQLKSANIMHESAGKEGRQAGMHGAVPGDQQCTEICRSYGRQMRLSLEQKLMQTVAELGSANAALRKSISEVGFRKVPKRLKTTATNARNRVLKALEDLISHGSRMEKVAAYHDFEGSNAMADYDLQGFATGLQEWVLSSATVGVEAERVPEWPWAASPGWEGLAQVDRHKQLYFRCLEEKALLLREARDMCECYRMAKDSAVLMLNSLSAKCQQKSLAAAAAASGTASHAATEGTTGTLASEPLEIDTGKKFRDLQMARGEIAWQLQRTEWLKERLKDAEKALAEIQRLHRAGGLQAGPIAAPDANASTPSLSQEASGLNHAAEVPPLSAVSTSPSDSDPAQERTDMRGQTEPMFGDQTADDDSTSSSSSESERSN
jgi:hypothetical protein